MFDHIALAKHNLNHLDNHNTQKKSTNSIPNSTPDFRNKQHNSRDHRDVRMRPRRLRSDLLRDHCKFTPCTLKYLRPYDFCVGAVGATGVDHQADAQESDTQTDNEDVL